VKGKEKAQEERRGKEDRRERKEGRKMTEMGFVLLILDTVLNVCAHVCGRHFYWPQVEPMAGSGTTQVGKNTARMC